MVPPLPLQRIDCALGLLCTCSGAQLYERLALRHVRAPARVRVPFFHPRRLRADSHRPAVPPSSRALPSALTSAPADADASFCCSPASVAVSPRGTVPRCTDRNRLVSRTSSARSDWIDCGAERAESNEDGFAKLQADAKNRSWKAACARGERKVEKERAKPKPKPKALIHTSHKSRRQVLMTFVYLVRVVKAAADARTRDAADSSVESWRHVRHSPYSDSYTSSSNPGPLPPPPDPDPVAAAAPAAPAPSSRSPSSSLGAGEAMRWRTHGAARWAQLAGSSASAHATGSSGCAARGSGAPKVSRRMWVTPAATAASSVPRRAAAVGALPS